MEEVKEIPIKERLLKQYPPNVDSMDHIANRVGFWSYPDVDKVQETSDKVIEIFKELDMTYTDAYAMLGYIRLDLDYRSERVRL